MMGVSLVDGQFSDHLLIDDRGLAYGDGLFETIAISSAAPEFISMHLQRLQRSCMRLSIELDVDALESEIKHLLSANTGICAKKAILKVIVTRQAGGRGYRPASDVSSHRILQLSALDSHYEDQCQQGVKVRVCHTRLSSNPALAGMKHLSRLENVIARSEWNDDVIFEGLMLDADGFVIEGVMSNCFLVKAGVLVTPHLDRCGVEGIMRELIMERLAPSLHIPVSLDRVLLEQIHDADEVFICNSLMGIVPVVSVGAFTKVLGPITRLLQQALDTERLSLAHV